MLLASTRIARLMQARFARLEHPLTLRQYRMLFRIEEGNDSPTALRHLMGLTPAAVSESVDILVRRKLVARSRSSEDGRRVVLKLTSEGEAALHTASHASHRLASEFELRLPEELRPHAEPMFRAICDIAAEELRTTLPQSKPFPE